MSCIKIILIDGHLFKVLPVQVGPLAHEQLYPTHIGCAEQNENEEYFPAVYGQHDTEDDYREGREQILSTDWVRNSRCGCGLRCGVSSRLPVCCQRTSWAAASAWRGIRDERHVARVLMWSSIQRRITSISVRLNTSMSCAAKMSCIKIQIPVPTALVYNSLGEKREDQLQQTACQQADDELHHRLFVGTYIVKQIPQGQFSYFMGSAS